MVIRSCLFGGALAAAGLAHAAPAFNLIDTPGNYAIGAAAYDVGGYGYTGGLGYGYGYGAGSLSYTYARVSAATTLSSTGAAVDVAVNPGAGPFSVGSAYARSEFTVEDGTIARLSWDMWLQGDGRLAPNILITDVTNQTLLFALGLIHFGPVGTTDIVLQAGVVYSLEVSVFAEGQASSTRLSVEAVPTPGVVAGVAVGGLVATRRRR